MEMWVNANLKRTSKILTALLNSDPETWKNPPGYSIIEGTYKGRKIICRLNSFSPSIFLHYKICLHAHIEPLSGKYNTYDSTSLTAVKSYFFLSAVTKDEFLQIFEELSRASEIIEAKTRNS